MEVYFDPLLAIFFAWESDDADMAEDDTEDDGFSDHQMRRIQEFYYTVDDDDDDGYDDDDDDGLSNHQMQRIGVINRSLVQETERCPICLELFHQESSILRQLACRHFYHETCLFHWLQSHITCPVCRFLLIQQQRNFWPNNDHDSVVGNHFENEMRMSPVTPNNLILSQLHTSYSLLENFQSRSQRTSTEPVIRRNPRRSVRRDINYRETLRYSRN